MSFGCAANLRGQLSRAQFAEWAVTTDSMARGGGTCIDGSHNDVVVAAITAPAITASVEESEASRQPEHDLREDQAQRHRENLQRHEGNDSAIDVPHRD